MGRDIELSSGIKVSIMENGNSKLVLFDRPVKIIELSRKESNQLGSSLMKNSHTAVIVKDQSTRTGSRKLLTRQTSERGKA